MNKYFIIILSFLAVTISSCRKPGCTDLKAENFNPYATEDDNSCTYRSPSTPRILSSENVSSPSSLPDNPYSEINYLVKYYTRITSDVVIESNVIIECKGSLYIEQGASITLMPGAELRFAINKGIEVRGKIEALGSANNPVVMTSEGENFWTGIKLSSNSNIINKFNYTNINKGGINVGGSNVDIFNCEISNCLDYAIINNTLNSGNCNIVNTLFLNNNSIMKLLQSQVKGIKSSNTYVGNTKNYITILTKESSNTIHFHKQSVPFQIHRYGSFENLIYCSSTLDSVIIDPGVIL